MATTVDSVRRNVAMVMLMCRDQRTLWYARLDAACCVGYVLIPFQLISDFVPVLGLLEDGDGGYSDEWSFGDRAAVVRGRTRWIAQARGCMT